jgi:serine O-acetyltransferase
MRIANLDKNHLSKYCRSQIERLVPTEDDGKFGLIDMYLKEALHRTERCFSEIKIWPAGELDILHSSQYCTFLYFLSNTIWLREDEKILSTKLFLLNKALNGIECFYEIALPEVFLIGHSIGIVLSKALRE